MKRWPSALFSVRLGTLSTLMALAVRIASAQPLAAPQPTPPDLPSTDLARVWIERDPVVQEAQRWAAAAEHAGTALAAGPHEWTARVTAQQRRIRDSGERSQEWNVGVERGVRIGGKAGLDRQLGESEATLASVRLNAARVEAAQALAELWLSRSAALQEQALAQEQVQAAEANLAIVIKRKRAGDASLLDQHAAEADLAETRRQLSQLSTQARKADLRLRQRFADAPAPQRVPLADPMAPAGTLEQWQERIAAVSETLRSARIQADQAELSARRASADRLPDPVVGVYTAQEAFRTERLLGLSLSMPLGSSQRRALERQRLQEADAQRSALERRQREVLTAVAETHTDAADGAQRWSLAEQAARSAAETARLMRRAYELGESDLQAVLLARRQSMDATRAALQARTEALLAHHRLLIEGRLIWASALEP